MDWSVNHLCDKGGNGGAAGNWYTLSFYELVDYHTYADCQMALLVVVLLVFLVVPLVVADGANCLTHGHGSLVLVRACRLREVQLLLYGATEIVRLVHCEATSVLVHCSDGTVRAVGWLVG